jgi:hypothetical protein
MLDAATAAPPENDSNDTAASLAFFPAFFTQGTFSFSFPAVWTGLGFSGRDPPGSGFGDCTPGLISFRLS